MLRSKMMNRIMSFACLVLIQQSALSHPVPVSAVTADLVLVNARIWTVNPDRPEVEALAAWQGRILAVGSSAEIKLLIGPKTVVIDGKGRRVVPGFHDSHLHLLGSGLRLSQVALKDAKDTDEFGRRLVDFDRKLPRDRWLIGGDWDHDRAFAGRLPSAADLDRYVSDRPVFLRRYDGHMALANTKALQLAGINADSPDPSDGRIDRDPATRQPTGILRDNAMALINHLVPVPDENVIIESVRAALSQLAESGVTSACDMEGSASGVRRTLVGIYQRMAQSGQLTARIEVRWPLADWDEVARMSIQTNFGNDYVRLGGVKGFIDGSLGSNTAKMFGPYDNEPTSNGLFVTPREKMRDYVAQADRAGLSIAIHAIGDQANSEMLDIYEAVKAQNGPRDRRFRIEHAQHLRPSDVPRFASLGVIPSMQPYHCIDDGRWAEGRIGPVRCASSYAFRSLIDSGAKLAFGSDWAVAPLNPLLGIDAAVNRRTIDGRHPTGWFPAQRITVAEAVEAFTRGSAFASHQDTERGTIATGKYADFVILSADIFSTSVKDSIALAEVLTTVVGGRIAFDKRPAADR